MPHTHSAKKELRKSIKRRVRNKKRKDAIKILKKEIIALVKDKKIDQAKAILPKFYKAADKAAKAHSINKNKASRLKSRITKFILKNK